MLLKIYILIFYILIINTTIAFGVEGKYGSFASQIKQAMDLYLSDSIKKSIDRIHKVEENSKNIKSINERISKDELACLNDGIRNILEIMRFSQEHRILMDNWAKKRNKDTKNRRLFFHRFDLKPELIKKIHNYSFPVISIHWQPFNDNIIIKNRHEKEIPDALGINNYYWQTNDNFLKKMAFLSFLRKLECIDYYNYQYNKIIKNNKDLIKWKKKFDRNNNFLKNETGFFINPCPWDNFKKTLTIKRSCFDYYTYQYVVADNLINFFKKHSLPLVKNIFDLTSYNSYSKNLSDFEIFYKKKLDFFYELLEEMKIISSKYRKKTKFDIYWTVYSFVCQSFPNISPFQLKKINNQFTFQNGFENDHPGIQSFDNNSIMGKLTKLKNDLLEKNNNCVIKKEELFGPVFLLQAKLNPTAITFDKQIQDVKIGFKGFYDYYKGLKD